MIAKRLTWAVALAALVLGAALALRYAENAGMIGDDGARRAMQVLIGLMLAGYANLMPKQLGRARGSAEAEARTRSALRVGGWSLTLAGLGYAALWALAPIGVADAAGMALVAGATLLTFAWALWAFTACRRVGDASAGR